jgi:two-component system LytT family response regulator
VRSGERTLFVPVDDVDRIEAFQNYVQLQSPIVNVQRISQLWSLAHGQYVIELRSGQRLQSGRTYGDKIRRVLSNPF